MCVCTVAWKGHTLQFTAVTPTNQPSRLQNNRHAYNSQPSRLQNSRHVYKTTVTPTIRSRHAYNSQPSRLQKNRHAYKTTVTPTIRSRHVYIHNRHVYNNTTVTSTKHASRLQINRNV